MTARYDERGGCVGCGCVVPLMVAPAAAMVAAYLLRRRS